MRQLIFIMTVILCISISYAGNTEVDLSKNVKSDLNSLVRIIPKERILNIEQFELLYNEVMHGKEKAYLIDVRTNEEFKLGHIQGTDHFMAGRMYKLPEFIKDPNEKIVIFCDTNRRSIYAVTQLMRYGYRNVWMYNDGIAGWIKRGNLLVNEQVGQFKVVEHRRFFQGQKLDPYRLRYDR